MNIEIRKERTTEYFETEAMTRRSFYNVYGPGCDEHLLVHKLRTHKDYLPELSRVALVDGKIVGTIMYFKAKIQTEEEEITIASFGPLCVDHKYKNMGIGGRLLQETISLVKEAGFRGIVIFGEPYYYPKFGFQRAGDFGLTDIEGNTSDAFMGLELVENGLHIEGGKFIESSVCQELTEEALEELDKNFPSLKKVSRPCQWSYPNAYDDREGYHYVYATRCPKIFETKFKEYMPEKADVVLKQIWESLDKTPYVIFTGKTPIGIMVISVEQGPEIEYLFIEDTVSEAEKIKKEIKDRFLKTNKADDRCEKYKNYFTKDYLMGPNSLRLLDELLSDNTDDFKNKRVLDLGCGQAITSVFLAKETEADSVYALDLWISATENLKRIQENGLEQRIIPIYGDALNLPFAEEYFDVIVSVDSYHYFGCEEGVFAEKILPYVKKGGSVMIVVPGLKENLTDKDISLLREWAEGDDADSFHTVSWWKEHLKKGLKEGIQISVSEGKCFDKAWEDWFLSGNPYGERDKEYFDKGLDKLLNFVMIRIERRSEKID